MSELRISIRIRSNGAISSL